MHSSPAAPPAKAAPSLAELTSLKPASSAHTKELDGSKDKSDEEWQKMVEDGDLTVQSYMVRLPPLPVFPGYARTRDPSLIGGLGRRRGGSGGYTPRHL